MENIVIKDYTQVINIFYTNYIQEIYNLYTLIVDKFCIL